MKNRIRSSKGQGITEYGFIIAFVAVLVACFFGIKGSLFTAINDSHKSASNALDQMNAASVAAAPKPPETK